MRFIPFIVAVVLSLGVFQSGGVSARDLTQEEMDLSGIYVRCPYDNMDTCGGIREVVRTIYTKLGFGEVAQNLIDQLEILNLLPATENGNPIATLASPKKGFINDLLWSAKGDKLAVMRQGTKKTSTFRIDNFHLVGADSLYVRAFSETELDEFRQD